MKDFSYHKLDNGLELVIVPRLQTKSVACVVLVRAGSRYETKNISGISHFLEHMFFKGTKKRPTARRIATEIDAVGGEFNAYTDRESTGYHIKAESSHLPRLLNLLADIHQNSLFKVGEIEREKKVITEELHMWADDPRRKAPELFEEMLYEGNPLGQDVGGTKETVNALKRNQIVNYFEKFYHPANLVIAVAGNCQQELVLKLVKKYFGRERSGKLASFKPVNDSQTKPKVKITYKETGQAHIVLGVRAYRLTHPARFPIAVLDAILGGGMSSRLFISVRERRGLAYYIYTASLKYADCGNFLAQAGVDLVRVEEAVKIMLLEFSKLVTKKVGEIELKKAKEYLKGRIALSHEDSRTLAFSYGLPQLLEGRVFTEEEIFAGIESVTPEQVQQVAKDIFVNQKLNLAVVGPFKEEEKFVKILKF